MNRMEIGEKLRLLRVKKNFTQDYIAFCLEISQPAYHKIENGKTNISLKQLEELAAIYKISVVDLLGNE